MSNNKNGKFSSCANIAQIIIAFGTIATFIFIVCQYRAITERDYEKQAMNIYYEYSKIILTTPPPQDSAASSALANIIITSTEAIYNYRPNSTLWKNTIRNIILENKQLTDRYYDELTVTDGYRRLYENVDCCHYHD